MSVHAVSFENGVTNQYQPFFNSIRLSMTMNDKAGRIKGLKALGASDFGTLGHEAFHAYKANFIEVQPQFVNQKNFLRRRAMNLYQSIPEAKREVTLEEAYASWIGWMLQSHISTISMIERLNSENCDEAPERLKSLWQVSWNASVQGYWYKDSMGEYWIEQFKAIKTLVTEGVDAYRRAKNSDGANFVDENLQPLDRRWIAQNLFRGRLKENFEETFKSELSKSVCASAFNLGAAE